MRKLTQQFISVWLLLSLLVAALAGLSPDWHRLIEHCGQGVAHTHWTGNGLAHQAGDHSTIPHGHPHPSFEDSWSAPAATTGSRPFANTHRSFSLPTLPLQRIWHTCLDWLQALTSPASNSPSGADLPGHEHHSLPQMLAGGLVDLAGGAPVHAVIPTAFAEHDFPVVAPFVAGEWYAQTASRGPPSFRG